MKVSGKNGKYPTPLEVIGKIEKILSGEEGPQREGDHEYDARYTYPERLKLIYLEIVKLKTLLEIKEESKTSAIIEFWNRRAKTGREGER